MSIQRTGEPNKRDVTDVRRLARQAASTDPDLGEPYVDADPHLMRWVLLIGAACCVVVISGLALIFLEVARHWVGLAQIALAETVLWLMVVVIDELIGVLLGLFRRFR